MEIDDGSCEVVVGDPHLLDTKIAAMRNAGQAKLQVSVYIHFYVFHSCKAYG